MEHAALSALARWANFYVIVGSSAGALIGLQFVVIVLIAEGQIAGGMREIRAFGSPTVVHFCAALLISAVMNAPWQTLSDVGLCLTACGVAGLAYSLRVLRHARKQTGYAPDAEDWIWYTVLPLLAFAALLAAGVLLWFGFTWSLFMIAAVSLAFLFLGIHNSWDTVTYIAVQNQRKTKESDDPSA